MRIRVISILMVCAWTLPLQSQSITESYARQIPPVTSGQYRPDQMYVVNSTRDTGNGVQWSGADLGIPPGGLGNIDAFSEGSDIFVPNGPAAAAPIGTTCRIGVLEFSVSNGTFGHPGSPIRSQTNAAGSESSGNGAGSDTFTWRLAGGVIPIGLALRSDHLGIAPSVAPITLTAQAILIHPVTSVIYSSNAIVLHVEP